MTDAPGSSRRWALKLWRTWPALVGIVLVLLTVVVVTHPGPLPGEVAYVRLLQRRGGPPPTFAEFVHAATGTEVTLVVCVLAGSWLIRRHRWVGARALSIVRVLNSGSTGDRRYSFGAIASPGSGPSG